MSYTLTPNQPQILHSATVTGNGGILLLRGHCERVTIALQSDGTTSGGTLTIEEAYYDPEGPVYAGTWSTLGSVINASAFTGTAQSIVHIVDYSVWALRVWISSDITGGGTVTVVAWGN